MDSKRIIGVVHKQWLSNKRDVFRIFDVFWWPTFELFVWGLFSVYLERTAKIGQINIVTMLLGAVILWNFFDRSSRDISITFIDELWNRNFVNLFSSPLRVSEYLVGITFFAFIKLILSAAFMFLIAIIFYKFEFWQLNWFFVPAAIGLTILGWSVSLVVQGFILRFGHTVEVFIWAAAVLVQPFSCVYYPVSTLPQWAQAIARFLPSTYLFENMRSNLIRGSVNWTEIGWSFLLNLIYFIGALWFFHRSFDNAREKGLLTREY